MKRFPSIKKNEDFRKVYRASRSYADSLLVLYLLPNGTEENRLGISVSKKVGNSIVRHRSMRLLREIFRLNNDRLKKGYDLVLIVREAAAKAAYAQLEESYEHLCARHEIRI